MTRLEAFAAAIDAYGTQEIMAAALNKAGHDVSQSTISRQFNSVKEVKPEWVLTIEADTKVSRHDLRPDIYPPSPDYTKQVSDMDCGEYGNRTPVLDKNLNGVAA